MCRETDGKICIVPFMEQVENTLGTLTSSRREVDENINNLLRQAAYRESMIGIDGTDTSSDLRKEAEALAKAERKKIKDAVGENKDLLDEPSEALLRLILLRGENDDDDYDYEYIHSVGLQLSKISSELLEIAFHKKGVSKPARKSLKRKVVGVLKEIFSRC